jgi:hypothetical protein
MRAPRADESGFWRLYDVVKESRFGPSRSGASAHKKEARRTVGTGAPRFYVVPVVESVDW